MEPHREWTAPGLRHDAYAAEPEAPPARLRPDALTAELRPVVDLYDSQVASLDAEIGAVLDELRRLNLYDRALVVVTSDHGESFGEHGVVGHGQSVFEPEVAIPLLIKYPGSRDAGRRPERVQLVDILPTIAAELGLPAPDGIEGDPVSAVRHPILAEFYTDPRAPEGVVRGYQAALYEGPLKLMAGDHLSGVFDVHDDPAERRSLATNALAQRRAWVDERRRTLEASLRARSQPVAPLDPGVERALRALGYVDDGEPAHP
jgi:arylsulfatase A-like enzyme